MSGNPEAEEYELESELNSEVYCHRRNINFKTEIECPELTKKSQYRCSYRPKKVKQLILKNKYLRTQNSTSAQFSQVNGYKSEYSNSYFPYQINRSIEKELSLHKKSKLNTPSYRLTTYNSTFADFKSIENKHVPLKQLRIQNPLKLEDKTTYNDHYNVRDRGENYLRNRLYVNDGNKTCNQRARDINKQLNRKMMNSSYSLSFTGQKRNQTQDKRHDHSTLLVFSIPTKTNHLHTSSIYKQDFNRNNKQLASEELLRRDGKIKKSNNFKSYKREQVEALRNKIKELL